MTTPSIRAQRLAKLETLMEFIVKGFTEIKQEVAQMNKVCGQTFTTMALFSGQDAQLKSLAADRDKLAKAVEHAFILIRAIEKDHAKENGGKEVSAKYAAKQEKFRGWLLNQWKEVIAVLGFIWWVTDYYHLPTKIAALVKEMTG